jgi:16S rRNA (guanine1207-N2)-methyltransferase
VTQYFDADPAVASEPRLITLRLPGLAVDLTTDRGVFSGSRVDPGTDILLRKAPHPPDNGDLLDLGCGYGPIAFALALRSPGARIWAVDSNRRALELVRDTAGRLNLGNVEVAAPDAVPTEVRFAAIYSNPPVRIGKRPLHELLTRWLVRLEPQGAAYLVVQRHLGADSLAAWLEDEGHTVRRLAAKRSYRVLEVRKASGG